MTLLTDALVTDRIRLLAGVEAEEMSNDDVDVFITMAKEWFGVQVGSAFDYADEINAYNNSIVYYACYLLNCTSRTSLFVKCINSLTLKS